MTYASPIEARFRSLLRWYPAEYRQAREEEIVATLMESSPPGRDRPSAGDVADLALGAVRAHWRVSLRESPVRATAPAAAVASLLLAAQLIATLLVRLSGDWGHARRAGWEFGFLTQSDFVVTYALNLTAALAGLLLVRAVAQRASGQARLFAVTGAILSVVDAGWSTGSQIVAAGVYVPIALLVAGAPEVALPIRTRSAFRLAALTVLPLVVLFGASEAWIFALGWYPQSGSGLAVILAAAPLVALAGAPIATIVFLVRRGARGAVLAGLAVAGVFVPTALRAAPAVVPALLSRTGLLQDSAFAAIAAAIGFVAFARLLKFRADQRTSA
ncbi:MAG: hypothetical protein QOI35_1221 [Cryptosporangiaceae bacterium]|jgi:hypothetical protein|nr:hypothetical protein [Cryptosporangiaceae bacterium]